MTRGSLGNSNVFHCYAKTPELKQIKYPLVVLSVACDPTTRM